MFISRLAMGRSMPEQDRRPTIADLAQRANVSKSIVSYVLNGRPGPSESTRQRVLATAAEMGWRPNSAARALSRARSGAVGLIVATRRDQVGIGGFFTRFLNGVEPELSRAGVALVLQSVTDVAAEMEAYERWWGERRVDGVIVTNLEMDDPRIELLERRGFPAVVAGGPGHHGSLPAVYSDGATAVSDVVRYLVALGHRRLARVAGHGQLVHTAIRTEAFLARAADAGLPEPTVIVTDYTREMAADATRSLLSARPRPTAIVYDNDEMAAEAMRVTREMGVDVPGEVSLVAGDDSPLCQLVHPPLSAVWRDVAGYGTSAAQLLLQVLDGNEVGEVPADNYRLVPRGSTGPAHEPDAS